MNLIAFVKPMPRFIDDSEVVAPRIAKSKVKLIGIVCQPRKRISEFKFFFKLRSARSMDINGTTGVVFAKSWDRHVGEDLFKLAAVF